MPAPPNPRQTARLRSRLFHTWFLLRRPMTLGVRAIVHDRAAGTVLLVRHTYIAGWHLPGGGVDPGETVETALARELAEEANVEMTGPPRLLSLHHNAHVSRRDHVALYLVEQFRQHGPKGRDLEIAEAQFFALRALPHEATDATRMRLAELFSDAPASPHW